jgi:hypothetical protein
MNVSMFCIISFQKVFLTISVAVRIGDLQKRKNLEILCFTEINGFLGGLRKAYPGDRKSSKEA